MSEIQAYMDEGRIEDIPIDAETFWLNEEWVKLNAGKRGPTGRLTTPFVRRAAYDRLLKVYLANKQLHREPWCGESKQEGK